jgi:hypothetical protein
MTAKKEKAADPNNTAGRLLATVRRVPGIVGAQTNASDGWAKLFGIAGSRAVQDREVVRLLVIMADELARFQKELQATPAAPDSYDFVLHAIQQSISLRSLGSKWIAVEQHISNDVIRVLTAFAELLPREEAAVDPTELADFSVEVEALAQRIRKSGLPDEVKAFLERQIDTVRAALREFPLRGTSAFKDASLRSAITLADVPPAVVENADAPEVREVIGLWERVAKYGRRLALVKAVVTALLGTGDLGLDVIEKALDLRERLALPPAPTVNDSPSTSGLDQ